MTLIQMAYIKPSKNDGIPYIFISTEWPLDFVDATFNIGLVGGHTPQGYVSLPRVLLSRAFGARSFHETILKMIFSLANVNNNNAINFGIVWLNLCCVIGARDFLFRYSGNLYYSVYHITCSFVASHKKRH